MTRPLRQISGIAFFIAAIFLCGELSLSAQQLKTPERWEAEFKQVSPIFRNDTVTIRFLGDVMMHQSQIDNAASKVPPYDFSSYFQFIREDLEDADISVANMEFALGGAPYTGYPAFSAPDQIAGYVSECGVDIFLLANNHIYDKGLTGAKRTISIYKEIEGQYGTRYIGLALDEADRARNHPLLTITKGIRIAFINGTYATNGGRRDQWPKVNYLDDKDDINLALKTAERKHADITIVLPHWGEEYHLRHSPIQEERAEFYARNGADLIIGSHPHVVQDTTSLTLPDASSKVPVIYSLGNTVSNMSAENTQLGLMATARIVRKTNGNITMLPVELTFLWCSRPGGYSGDSYVVIPVEEFIDKRELWHGEWDYDKMIRTYRRVLAETGIE